jgi:predicted phage terminase large subunit-like protein
MTELQVCSQLQCRPTSYNGQIYLAKWLNNRSNNFNLYNTWLSFDTASTAGGAYSACVVGQLDSAYRMHVVEVDKRRLEFNDLMAFINEMVSKYRGQNLEHVLIENKSSGVQAIQSLIDTADNEIRYMIDSINPVGSKIERAQAQAIWLEKGLVWFPYIGDANPWLPDFLDDLVKFPVGKFKDTVDAFDQLLDQASNFLLEGLEAQNALKEGIY